MKLAIAKRKPRITTYAYRKFLLVCISVQNFRVYRKKVLDESIFSSISVGWLSFQTGFNPEFFRGYDCSFQTSSKAG